MSGIDRACHLLNEETDATGLLAGVQTKIERETSRKNQDHHPVHLC